MFFSLLGSMLIGGLYGAAAGAVLGAVVDWFIDEDTLSQAVVEEYDDAFKLLIKEKKKKAVKVGIFDDDNELLDDVEIQSNEGVSDSLYKGQIIYV